MNWTQEETKQQTEITNKSQCKSKSKSKTEIVKSTERLGQKNIHLYVGTTEKWLLVVFFYMLSNARACSACSPCQEASERKQNMGLYRAVFVVRYAGKRQPSPFVLFDDQAVEASQNNDSTMLRVCPAAHTHTNTPCIHKNAMNVCVVYASCASL